MRPLHSYPGCSQEGMPDNQIYMVSTTTAMIAVTAIESATPSASRSALFVWSDTLILQETGFEARHYSSIGWFPKPCTGLTGASFISSAAF